MTTQTWLSLFLEFIDHLTIDSKETGVSKLHLYGSQARFLEQVCEGLDRGVRHFVCLKARQLGISTVSLAMDLFWLSVHEGLQGALITDTDGNRDKFRILLERYMASLPRSLRAGVVKHNRSNLVLHNGSVLDYVVAGTRKTASSTMARSRAWNFVHGTECSSWGSEEGMASMMASLAQKHPDRLYVFESTARGKNLFWEMCNDAAEDVHTQKMFFIGWWAKEDYAVERDDPRFKEYWTGKYDSGETVLMKEVAKKYGVEITPEQIVWHRWMRTVKIGDEDLMNQEYPWTADQAFIESGKSFFPARRVADDIAFIRREHIAFKGFTYRMTENFMQTELEQVTRIRDTELRIWEDPHPNGIYVAGVDPAYGRSDLKDRHCIEVYRCFADRLVQIAEYATDVPETYQVAWVLAHLAGSYKNIWINLEINGPGPAVMRELQHLRQLMDSGIMREQAAERRMHDVFDATRWYLYHRPDSLGAGYAYGWKCLALDTPLPTSDGWTTMGDVRVGDTLIDDGGQRCTVTGVSPIQINHKCYRLTFDDGTQIVADEDHLWPVHRHLRKNWGYGRLQKLRKTSQLKVGKYKFRVAEPLALFGKALPIDPYVLGVWLGDGASDAGRFYACAEDIEEIGDNLRARGVTLGGIAEDRTCCRQTIEGLGPLLKTNNLLQNKHIPPAYLRASFTQRLALLQGLMDTDGNARIGCRQATFTTSNRRLSVGFSELLRTLGLKAKYCVRFRVLNYAGQRVACVPAHQFYFAVGDLPVFKLSRKMATINASTAPHRKRWHNIVKIEEVESVPVRCIAVDSPSHLYLAGEGMIPTHNTTMDNKLLILNQMRDAYSLRHLTIRSVPLLQEMETVVQDGSTIEGSGRNKDDRVFATALAHKAYVDWIRPNMIANNLTYEMVTRQERAALENPGTTLMDAIIQDFFKKKEEARADEEVARAWGMR